MNTQIRLIITIAPLVALFGCATSPSPSVIGNWKGSDGFTYDFKSDGTANVSYGALQIQVDQAINENKKIQRRDFQKYTWTLDSTSKPNRLVLSMSLPDYNIRYDLNAVLEFTSSDTMRWGTATSYNAPFPENFDVAPVKITFVRN